MKYLSIARKFRTSWKGFSGYCMFLFLFLFPDTSISQWREVRRFDDYTTLNCVRPHPNNPNIVFYGARRDTGKIWKSYDRGKNWKLVFKGENESAGEITSIIFKDSLVGWFTCYEEATLSGKDASGCYKTTDAGETWSLLPGTNGYAMSVYYHPYNHRLFLIYETNSITYPKYSDDYGATWNSFATQGLNDVSCLIFIDSLRGLLVTPVASNNYYHYLTSDAGNTWSRLPNFHDLGGGQPVILHGKVFIPMSVHPATVFGSNIFMMDPWGSTPVQQCHLVEPTNGGITSDSTSLYIQPSENGFPLSGILKSTDEGKTWVSLCGPNNFGFSTYPSFFVDTAGEIWAGQVMGRTAYYGLWHNPTGKPNGPRLQLLTTTGSADIHTTTGSLIPIQISYPNESYFEPVDSVTFIIKKSGEFLGFDRLSPMPDWQIIRIINTDSDVTCTIRYVGSNQPITNMAIGTLFFKTYIAPDTTGTIALDAVTFNQDTTFRECMLASLTSSDSVTVHLDPSCSDSLIRQQQAIKSIIRISSISPNPSSDRVSIEFYSAEKTDIQIQLIDALGNEVKSLTTSATVGLDKTTLIMPDQVGVYYLRLSTPQQTVTEKVIRE